MAASAVRLGPSGLVVVRSSPPEDRERLLRTADLMRLAQGIAVEVLTVRDDEDGIEVSLAYAGRVPEAPMSGEAVSALGAKVAALLGDLHSLGVQHGRVEPDHVLVDAESRVRLCGFGESAPGDGSTDVRALGDLLDALLEPGDRSKDAMAVRAVIERTRAAEAPTAGALAASLASIGQATRVYAPVVAHRRRVPRAALVGAALVVTAVIGVALAWPRAAAPSSTVALPTSTSTSTSTPTTSTTVAATRVWPASPRTIEHDGVTWTLGDTSDVALLVASWGCSPTATPALVRADGTVWLVRSWLDDQKADYVTTIEDEIVDARVSTVDGCDDLVVTTSTGTVRPLAA